MTFNGVDFSFQVSCLIAFAAKVEQEIFACNDDLRLDEAYSIEHCGRCSCRW